MGGEYASLRCVLPRGDLTCGFQEALLLLLPELPNLPAVNSSALVTMGIFKRRTDSSEPSCPLGPQLLSDCASLSSPFLAPFSKFKHFFLGFYSCFVFLKNTLQVSGRGRACAGLEQGTYSGDDDDQVFLPLKLLHGSNLYIHQINISQKNLDFLYL